MCTWMSSEYSLMPIFWDKDKKNTHEKNGARYLLAYGYEIQLLGMAIIGKIVRLIRFRSAIQS